MHGLRSQIAKTLLAFPTVLVALPGCGGGAGEPGFNQEFEPPAAAPPAVENPADTGEDLSPRERR
ncbi:hypothetical protein [Tautonia sociabilis]|uniref:Uncharacterized protein n=1 Tax=Tautonia sociabilis TaxID=2080755 RepID=A0A432MP64_9BACT|nr:hypothetical protein [Tautonia sociabilis]RUL89110.1 hypothetical protein TsocGM_03050 [Tautonia sociabilis]